MFADLLKLHQNPQDALWNVPNIIRSVTNIVCNRLQVIIPLVQSVRSGCTREWIWSLRYPEVMVIIEFNNCYPIQITIHNFMLRWSLKFVLGIFDTYGKRTYQKCPQRISNSIWTRSYDHLKMMMIIKQF